MQRQNVGQSNTAQSFVGQQTQQSNPQAGAQQQGTRQNVGAGVGTGGSVALAMPTSTRIAFDQLGRNAGGNKWYLSETDSELQGVTSEAQNLALGITNILLWPPTDHQMSQGIVAKATLETLFGKITNISIREPKERDGSIYVQLPGRDWTPTSGDKAGQKQWFHDIELTKQAKAQILRYVNTFLVPNQ